MNCCCSNERDREAKLINKKIEAELRKSRRDQRREVKLLLLGEHFADRLARRWSRGVYTVLVVDDVCSFLSLLFDDEEISDNEN